MSLYTLTTLTASSSTASLPLSSLTAAWFEYDTQLPSWSGLHTAIVAIRNSKVKVIFIGYSSWSLFGSGFVGGCFGIWLDVVQYRIQLRFVFKKCRGGSDFMVAFLFCTGQPVHRCPKVTSWQVAVSIQAFPVQ